MRDSVYRISLDIHNESPQVQIVARQGDKSRRIYMTLQEHGKPWVNVINGQTRAVLTVVTPKGVPVLNECDIRSDGTVVYDFIDQITAETGVEECELQVFDVDDGILCTPRFTIVVTENAFDGGQIAGSEWRAAIADVKETLNTVKKLYDNAEDMANADLAKGQKVQTLGRWFPNDGGARTYTVTDTVGATLEDGALSPLAVAIKTKPGSENLYAIPVIDDRVTAFDIGLKKGNITGDDNIGSMTAYDYGMLDGKIPAENSRLLQYYIDHVPEMGSDPGVAAAANSKGLPVDIWVKYGVFSRFFFPAGNWIFRDPIIVNKPIKFFGAARTAKHYHNRAAVTREAPVSNLFYKAREFTVAEESGESVYPYVCTETGKRVTESRDPGEHEIDMDVPGKRETTFVNTALFYVSASGVSFVDLLISTANAFTWYAERRARTTPGTLSAPGSYGFRPGEATDDTSLMGEAYDVFHTKRLLKGVCGVVCMSPKQDEQNRILVNGSGVIQYENDSGSNIEQSKTNYTMFSHCHFDGFSGTALIMGSLARVDDCHFRNNYIALSSRGHDNWIHNIYAEQGFVGLQTMSHTMIMDDSYIDLMQAFGICPSFSVRKKHAIEDGSDVSWVCDTVIPYGVLVGKYDCFLDYCCLGAYAAEKVTEAVLISGKIGHCGTRYSAEDTAIAEQDDFGTLLNYDKAADAVDGATGRDSLVWDDVERSWSKTSTEQGEMTLAEYLASADGKKYTQLYENYKTAHIKLLATTAAFLDNSYSGDLTVYQQLDVAKKIAESDEDVESIALAWLKNEDHLVEPLPAGAAPATLSEYSTANQEAAISYAITQLSGYEDSEIQAWRNRQENFARLIGASAISIRLIDNLNIIAGISLRVGVGKTYNGVQKVHLTPVFGINCINAYNSSALCDALNLRSSRLIAQAGKSSDERKSAAKMNAIYSSGYNYMRIETPRIPFAEKTIYFKTLLDETKTDNYQRYKYLGLVFVPTTEGGTKVNVWGYLSIVQGTDVTSVDPETYDGNMMNYVDGEPTGGPANPYFNYNPYDSHYNTGKLFVRATPLIAVTTFTSGNDSVALGDIVATLIINFRTGKITVHPLKTYTGEVMPVSI